MEHELAETETAMRRARTIEQDHALRAAERRKLDRFRRMAGTRPALANAGLIQLALEVASDLARSIPKAALARCVSIQVFYTHHLDADTKVDLPTVAAFEAFVGALDQPNEFLMGHLSPVEPIFPAKNSWLIPADRIAGLSADRTREFLQVDYRPPLVIFHMPLQRLHDVGVTVRKPRSIDTVAHDFAQWRPSSVPGELIDADVPRSAIDSIEWRP